LRVTLMASWNVLGREDNAIPCLRSSTLDLVAIRRADLPQLWLRAVYLPFWPPVSTNLTGWPDPETSIALDGSGVSF
jgi:hypothetical protein